MPRQRLLILLILTAAFRANGAIAQMPPAIAAPGEATRDIHAEGAQIYECKAGNAGNLSWVFREPIATLLLDDKTVGRHYAGPTWEHRDGSAVTGKAVGNAPGATADDIPWLKLEVVNRAEVVPSQTPALCSASTLAAGAPKARAIEPVPSASPIQPITSSSATAGDRGGYPGFLGFRARSFGVSFAIFRRFWAVAARRNSSCAPFGPRSRSRSSSKCVEVRE